MEEETSEEWEIKKQGNSKMGLIMRVWKKIVITGMVITSAPLLLPPIVLVSSVGFAFAVPFGLVFAGYACTDKVMSKLLSRPNVEVIERDGRDDMEMDMEEEEFEEDLKKSVEMRIELEGDEFDAGEECSEESMEDRFVEDLKGEIEEYEKLENEGYLVEDAVVAVVNEQEKENGFLREEMPMEETVLDTGEEGLIQEYGGEEIMYAFEEGGIPIDMTGEAEREDIDAYVLGETVLEEVPVEETEEDFREGGNGVNGVVYVEEEEPLELEVVLESGYKGVYYTPTSIEEKAVVEDKMDSSKEDEMEEEEKPLVATMGIEESSVGLTEDNISKEEIHLIEATELKVTTIIENAREIADESGLDLFDVVTATLEQYHSESDEDIITPDMVSYHISQSVEVNSLPKHIRVELSSANEEHILDTASEECVDSVVHPVSYESVKSQPINLVPETTTSKESYQVSPARVADSAPENVNLEVSSDNGDHTADIMSKESVVPLPHPISSDTFEAQPVSLVSDTTPSKEALYSEEKMWELMGAIQKIVGYKGAIQPNFSEELKALYIFIGVEPPATLKDPLDLVEVNDKIRLLMGIIGVK